LFGKRRINSVWKSFELPRNSRRKRNSSLFLKYEGLPYPSSIAEGYGRRTIGEYIQSLYIAYGSVCELETQMMLSGDLDYVEDVALSGLMAKIGDVERLLKGLIKS